jgi:hypothetical protein
VRSAEFGYICEAGVEEIFLAKVAEFSAEFLCYREVIINDQPDTSLARDGEDGLGHVADCFERGLLGAKLDQIRAAIAKLSGHKFRSVAMEVRGIDESVEPAFGKRFHEMSPNNAGVNP